RVIAFMRDVDEELWKLGIPAKTEHNEAAPAQHELAPVFTTANIAADNNQLVMEVLRKTAEKHNMKCILHEKPFAGVNGSGKHVNWSLSTDTGLNLFEPGDTPHQNAQFLLFLCAVLKAVDDYQELLRISVAYAGNDLRLGGNEAPPAVISVFLGEELTGILDAIENELDYSAPEKEMLKIGVDALPWFPKDTTDRNRTSPFAFTGNKFEFRSPGSSMSISEPIIALNTAVAQVLEVFADRLEGAENFNEALHNLICHEIQTHKRIIFNGNGYDKAWIEEAARRGLSNLPTTPQCLKNMLSEKNVTLYAHHHVLSETEFHARYEIMAENYCKLLRIEALTMLEMSKRHFLPCVSTYTRELAETIAARRAIVPEDGCVYEAKQLSRLSALLSDAQSAVEALENALDARHEKKRAAGELALYFEDHLLPPMQALRSAVDEMETITEGKRWPYPNYGELLFSVK
ncbi:MAG: glutamine synthetase type III, partial [Oscillospiraceae bacterium]|nr:glutamine synthetase type III [Oscillospiraceae bacterium]